MVISDMSTALTVFAGERGLRTASGIQLSARTRRAYNIDLRQIFDLLGEGKPFDPERERSCVEARMRWCRENPATRSTNPPTAAGSVLDRFFALDRGRVDAIIAEFRKRCTTATVARKIAALRTLWRTARDAGLVKGDPFVGIRFESSVREIQPIAVSIWLDLTESTPEQIVSRVLRATSTASNLTRSITLRDLALLLLFMVEGVRSGDLLQCGPENYTPPRGQQPGQMKIVSAHGAISRNRTIALHPSTCRALDAYVASLSGAGKSSKSRALVRASDTARLFLNKRGEDLSARSMRRKLTTLLARLGYEGASPARLRQSGIVDALASGLSIADACIRFGFVPTYRFDRFIPCVEPWKAAKVEAQRDNPGLRQPAGATAAPAATRVSAPATIAVAPSSSATRPPSPYGRARSLLGRTEAPRSSTS